MNIGLTESLFQEFATFNIRVLIIEPGGFRTNVLTAFVEPASGLTKDYLKTPR
jgi:NAD(P)-dependent dehydrogenase (short-subunit alcohol dehydrogenase family)